jgi:hypothetical protein
MGATCTCTRTRDSGSSATVVERAEAEAEVGVDVEAEVGVIGSGWATARRGSETRIEKDECGGHDTVPPMPTPPHARGRRPETRLGTRLEAWLWTGPAGHLLGGTLDVVQALARYLRQRRRSD